MQHQDWLLEQAKNICRDPRDAEDLAQETILRFVKAFQSVEALPHERSCGAWLTSTLHNLFIDLCRRQQVQSKGARDLALLGDSLVALEPPNRPVYDSLTDEQYDQAVGTLSPLSRATLELHVEGKKYRDIARALGIKEGTVGKRLHDARNKLRTVLRKYLGPGAN